MSSNDDDRPTDDDPTDDRIVPDRNWVLRPNRNAPSTPKPPVPPPGAPGAPSSDTGDDAPGRGDSGPGAARRSPEPGRSRPSISAPSADPGRRSASLDDDTQAIPVTASEPSSAPTDAPPPAGAPAFGSPASPPPAAPPSSGPVRSWGAPLPTPAAPTVPPAAAPRPAPPVVPAGASAPADPPTLTPSDSPTVAAPGARSSSPSNVTLGPPERNALNPQPLPPQVPLDPPPVAPQAARPEPAPAAPAPAPAAPPATRQAAQAPGGRSKGGTSVADLAQQLAATQAQVAALSAQLTTLAHRLTYDVERGAQTTSERVARDLERTLAEAVALRVGAHLGPAVDDLTDQIAEDFAPKVEAMTAKVGELSALDLGGRLAAVTDAIDSLPIGNVEVLGQLDALGSDLQDRFQRFATRLFDQFENLERSNLSELLRLRDHIEELRTSGSGQGHDVETLRRISTHVERLAQRTPGTAGIVAAVETLITEHLETVGSNLDQQVAALAPTLQVELDAVRAENLTALGSIEHDLLEQLATLEAGLIERFDGVMADHVDNIDGILAERQGDIIAAVTEASNERVDEAVVALTDVGAARLEEVAAVANLGADKIEELTGAVQDLQTVLVEADLGGGGGSFDPTVVQAIDALMSTVVEELQALRKKITEQEGGLTPAQVDDLGKAVAKHLLAGRAEGAAPQPGAHVAKSGRRRSSS